MTAPTGSAAATIKTVYSFIWLFSYVLAEICPMAVVVMGYNKAQLDMNVKRGFIANGVRPAFGA